VSTVEARLLDEFQRDFPLVPRPFASVAERLGVDEATVLDLLRRLTAEGAVSRVGAVVAPHRAGYSTLVAMSVPPEMLEGVADLVSSFPEVNHNYEREHRLNLWFVVATSCPSQIPILLKTIACETGYPVLNLPREEEYFVEMRLSA
jgi:DNA-binding Lrp family transcriptional regulator